MKKLEWLSEEKLIDNVARIVPWLAPLIPASFAYRNVTSPTGLNMTWWEGLVVAIVVELLGIATVYTFFSLFEETKRKKGYKPFKEMITAGGMAIFYLSIVVVVNILLDLQHTPQIIAARALLSLISIPASVTLSIRNLQKLRQSGDKRDSLIASLRGKLGSLTKKHNTLSLKHDSLMSQHDSLMSEIKLLKGERNKLKSDIVKLHHIVDTEVVYLDNLPPILADYVTVVAQGETPNGQFTEKYDIGESSLVRANSILLRKQK